MFDLAARQGVTLTLLDIGGGFPGWDGSECVYHQAPPPNGGGEIVDGAPSPTAVTVKTDGAAGGGGEEEAMVMPTPPLSLAEIAEVTVPVLDELFPLSSGVQVKSPTNFVGWLLRL